MLTTTEVLRSLRAANPGTVITEDRIRHALRRGDLPSPESFAGRLAWSDQDIAALAQALKVEQPSVFPDLSRKA